MDALEAAVSDSQLREWSWFYELEPWGAEVEFMRTGIIASTVVNVAPNRKPGAKPSSPRDFMPSERKRADMDPKRIRSELLSAFAGRVKKKDP